MKKLSLVKAILVCLSFTGFSFGASAGDVPTYDELKAQYDAGSPIPIESFRGTWKFVEFAMRGKCVSTDHACNRKDMNGLKDKNGLDMDAITFADFTNPRTKKVDLGVSITNVGGPNTDQGPEPVRADEPQFAFKGCNSNSCSNDFLAANSCRMVKGSQDVMLCNQLRLDSHNFPGTVFIYDGQVVGYRKVQ